MVPGENTARSSKTPKSVWDPRSRGDLSRSHWTVVTPQGRNLFWQRSTAFYLVYSMHFTRGKDSVVKIWKLLYKTMSWWLYSEHFILWIQAKLTVGPLFSPHRHQQLHQQAPHTWFLLSVPPPQVRLCAPHTAPITGTPSSLCHCWILLLPVLPLFPS